MPSIHLPPIWQAIEKPLKCIMTYKNNQCTWATWAITETIDVGTSSPFPCVTQDNQHKQIKIGKFWRCP